MKTGVVVNNYDPTYQNRIQVRVYGMHTEKVGDKYKILDDDLPWALPAPSIGGNNGTYSVPGVGARVYVDGDSCKLTYYGQVEVKGNVKKMMHEHADQSDKLKVIAFSEDYEDGEKDYLKIYYLPESGLNIECNGHRILMTKYDGLLIESSAGSKIEMTRDGDINIKTDHTINLDCEKVNITSGSLDDSTIDRIVKGDRMQKIFNSHTHFVSSPGGVTTTEPINKIKETDMSSNIRISNK